MPNSASSVPAGKGGSRRAPLTKCAAGTGMDAPRPGRESSFVIIESLRRPNITTSPSPLTLSPPPEGTGGLENDLLVAQLADLVRSQPALGQDLVGVLAAPRRGAAYARRHPRESERRADHGNLSERGVRDLLDDAALECLRVRHHLGHGIDGRGGDIGLGQELQEPLALPLADHALE